MRRVLKYIKEFGSVTTLHGISHIVSGNRHPAEIYLWVAVTVVAAVTSLYLIVDNWQRYNANPTVLSLDKNFRSWRVPFPAATVCLFDRVNRTAATALINRLWGVKPKDKKFPYYMRFVQSVGNMTYDNLEEFEEFQYDSELYTVNLPALARMVQINLTYSSYIFNPLYKYMKFEETITEMGICYTYNGVLTDYISLSKNVKTALTKDVDPPYCNFLNSLCYARIEDLPGMMRYYIHSPFEIPDLSSQFYIVQPSRERDTSFRFLQTVPSPDLRDLLPRQRNCRFMDEPKKDMSSPVYSYNLCRMNCRKRLAFTKCGCAPYFYLAKKDIPVCTVKGLACLVPHRELITKLILPDGSPYPCPCTLPCKDIEYYVDKDVERDWSYPVPCNIRFRWAIEVYAKTRVRREIIFGLEDLLVSFGGTAAFFLGFSVITFVEIIYFFTLRLYWFLRSHKNEDTKVVQKKLNGPKVKVNPHNNEEPKVIKKRLNRPTIKVNQW
ncbi:pickpocket protein 19-like [Macrosteles quadrilineatus]|uniref:pickpocket protein 19-like n=1 Tax=Macrosteles quadrilineatus TaxID=74068 RepID=UPI0023E2D2C0|nr:pickpocket protein 19-like [Macrosteles quadrilineatus]